MSTKQISVVSVRMPTELKNQTEKRLSKIGLNFSSLVNMVANQFIIQGKLPFEVYSYDEYPQSVYDALDRATEARLNGTAKYVSMEEAFAEWDSIITEAENAKI